MYKIDIDDYTFHVKLLSYEPPIPPNPNADNDWDYYGHSEEVDWKCIEVVEYDEDGWQIQVYVDHRAGILSQCYAEEISSKLLEEVRSE